MDEITCKKDYDRVDEFRNQLTEMTQDVLAEPLQIADRNQTIKLPFAELSTLGAAVSAIVPQLITFTQTYSFSTEGLYRVANQGIGEALKKAADGNFWGALKDLDGTSKMAKFQPVDELSNFTATSVTTLPIDPATAMIAIALYSIEKDLDQIQEMEREILSFLEIEKESEVEADVEMLMDITRKYKSSWDNEYFLSSGHKMVLDIQRTARKNITFYYKKINDTLDGKKLALSQSQVNTLLEDLEKMFKYYRLSLYIYSLASLMEIMLSGNFNEEYIQGIKRQIVSMSKSYRNLFDESSLKLEKASSSAIESNVLKGIGVIGSTFGKAINKIPVLEKGHVDEFLTESGDKLKQSSKKIQGDVVREFAQLNNPKTTVFVKKMDDMIMIFNHTEEIGFDSENLYLSC